MADTLLFAGRPSPRQTKRIPIGIGTRDRPVPSAIPFGRRAARDARRDVGGARLVGLGRGYQQREFNGFGVPQHESNVRFREATEIIDGLLTHESFSYDGKFWTVNDLTICPRPFQQPRPPIFLAASARRPRAFEWIVEKGYGALIGNPYSLDP